MGYTSSGDMKRQVRLRFDTEEAAIAYAEKNGIAYRVEKPKKASRRRQFPMRRISAMTARSPGRTDGARAPPGPVAQLDRAPAF
jgi:hypothetical protein